MNVAKQWRNSSMNAMQKMTEGMIKENQPKFEVGDTVRVSVRMKATRSVSRLSKVPLLLRSMAASRRPSPSAAPLMVLALSVCSRSTARSSRTLRLFAAVRFAVQSCSICAAAPARPPRSRLASDYRPICSKRGGRLAFFPFCFINFYARQGGLDWLWQVPL